MSSILILATRCRQLTHRLSYARNILLKISINCLPANGCHSIYQNSVTITGGRQSAMNASAELISLRKESMTKVRATRPKNILEQDERIINKLIQSTVSLPFVSFDELKNAIDAKLTDKNARPLMLSCSRQCDRSVAEKLELVNRIWCFLVKSKNSGLPYAALIESYQWCGKIVDDPHAFLADIGAPNDVNICEQLIQLMCANNHSIDAATNFLVHMTSNKIAATERAYCALIVGAAVHTKSMETSEEIVQKMEILELSRTHETHAALIKANIECGNEQQAIAMLKQHNNLDSNQLYAIILLAAIKCEGDAVVKNALNLLPEPVLNAKNIAIGLQNICIELLHASGVERYYDPYELIIRHLPSPVFVNENTDEYGHALFKEMLSINVTLPRLVQFCEHLIVSERNTRAIHVCCGIAMKGNLSNTQDLLRILADKEPLRAHYFWPLFVRATNENEILKLIKFAADTNAELDAMTIEKHILRHIPHTMNDSRLAAETLEKFGLKMHPLRMGLMSFLLQTDRPNDALNIAKLYIGRIDALYLKTAICSLIKKDIDNCEKMNLTTIARLIQNVQMKTMNKHYDLGGEVLIYVVNNIADGRQRFATTVELIHQLRTAKVRISAAAANSVLDRVRRQRDVYAMCEEPLRNMIDKEQFPEVSANDPRPSIEYASIEDMEHHLVEMESNLLNTRGEFLSRPHTITQSIFIRFFVRRIAPETVSAMHQREKVRASSRTTQKV